MSVWDRLDGIQVRADKATDGPWFQGREGRPYEDTCDVFSKREPEDEGSHDIATYIWSPEDAEFIAHARTDVPALVAALRAVLDLHKAISEEGFDVDVCERCSSTAEAGVAVSWPCLTVRVIENSFEEN